MGFIITPAPSNEEEKNNKFKKALDEATDLSVARPELDNSINKYFEDEINKLIEKRAAELDDFLKEKMNLHLKWYHKLFILFNKKVIRKYVKIILQKGESISQLEKRGVQIYNEIYWLD